MTRQTLAEARRQAEEALLYHARGVADEVSRLRPCAKALRALLAATAPDPRYVYFRVLRPEGYEDVHPELVLDDMRIADCWRVEVLP